MTTREKSDTLPYIISAATEIKTPTSLAPYKSRYPALAFGGLLQ